MSASEVKAASSESAPSDLMIQVEGLHKRYGLFRSVPALNGVDLQIKRGEIFGLIGPNGSGKTTLMGCMLALLRPTEGKVRVQGLPPDDRGVRSQTGFLPERPNFDAWMTAQQFVSYHHELAHRPRATRKQDVEAALTEVELEPAAWNRRIKKFSRGMLQRLGLAQMLIGKPTLCLLDEPASGMDPLGVNLVRRLLLKWKEEGVTVIVNSHHLAEVERVCDRVAFIRNGKIERITELGEGSTHVLIVRWQNLPDMQSPDMKTRDMKTPDMESALETVAQSVHGGVSDISHEGARFTLPDRSVAPLLIKALIEAGVPVEEVTIERANLEGLFLEGTDGE
jgi:ABC-2 type transport system ATP-binding protein